MPFSIASAKPKVGATASASDWTARPAVFRAAASGSSPATPVIAAMRTPGSAVR